MPKSLIEKMTKEQLIQAVKDYSCGRLRNLPLDSMTKEDILKHLIACDCPMIKKLLQKQI